MEIKLLSQKDSWYWYFVLAAIGLYLGLGAVYIFYGSIHPDEGHYLLVGKLIYQGMVPYRDFQYVQTPLFPYINGLFQLLIGSSLKAGRFISFLLGFLTFIMAIRLAYKLRGSCAAAITAGLIGFNPFIIYSFTITKLFALTAFLITLSYSIWCSSKLSNTLRYSLSLMIMCLAVGVRISVLPAVVILLAAILIKEWRKKQVIFFAALPSFCSVSIIFLPFYFLAPEQFVFDLFTYHGLRDFGGLWNIFISRFEAISGLTRDFFFPLLLFCMLIPAILTMIKQERHNNQDTMVLAGIIITVSSIHFLSRNSYISFYMSIIFPLFALLIGIAVSQLMGQIGNEQVSRSLIVALIFACVIFPTASARSFTVPAFKANPVKRIEELGEFIRNNTFANDLVMTYNNSIAMEAGRMVLPGTEMNSISFEEDWGENRCRRFKLLNKGMLLKYIHNKIPKVIILTKLFLSRSFPGFTLISKKEQEIIFAAIAQHYKLVKVYKNFGYSKQDETYVYLKN